MHLENDAEFNETYFVDLTIIAQIDPSHISYRCNFQEINVPVYNIGKSVGHGIESKISIIVKNSCLESRVLPLMQMWEETSHRLELHQTTKACADQEYNSLANRKCPVYKLTFDPDLSFPKSEKEIKVAVIREEGSNGDREMAAAFVRVGFKVWDVTMQDLLSGDVDLNEFRGVIFPGGFSYAG